jgi:hypothetical protein
MLVQILVTTVAECYEIGLDIIASLTSEGLMMNFKVLHDSALLTSPVVASKYPLTQTVVLGWVQP